MRRRLEKGLGTIRRILLSREADRVLAEELIIVVSVLKWIVLATCVGLIVGTSTALFLKLLHSTETAASQYRYYFLLLPAGLFASALLVKWLAPDAEGHGTEKVIEAVHKNSGRMNAAVVPVKLAATIITIGSGGSVGKEGPCAQIGAGLASMFASLLRFDDKDRRKLVICGISAGFASVFGTPIAGAIFGVEVLFAGSILYDVLLPSFIAGVTAFQIASNLGVAYFYHPIDFVPVFSQAFFLKVVLAGIVFGVVSALLILTLNRGQKMARSFRIWKPLHGLIGGAFLAGLALLVGTDYLGLGLDSIQTTLGGWSVPWYAFLLKMLFTSVTLGFGGSGGIVTPIFFVGATAGSAFANILHLDPATFAAVGMVCLLAGAANTPIAASILAVELFGPAIAPYTTVACVVAFLMTGHRSVYPSQILAMRKSPSIRVELGRVMSEIDPETPVRVRSLIVLALRRAKHLGRSVQDLTGLWPDKDSGNDRKSER